MWFHGPIYLISNSQSSKDVTLPFTHVAELSVKVQPIPSVDPVIALTKLSSYQKVCAIIKIIFLWHSFRREPLEALVHQEQSKHTPSLYTYITNNNTPVTPDI